MRGVLFLRISNKSCLLVKSLHIVLLLPNLSTKSSPIFQHVKYNNSFQMYFIKALLSPRSQSRQQPNANQILANTRVTGSGRLHCQYLGILNKALLKVDDEEKCLKMVISKLQSLNSIEEIVKLFTLIHNLLIERHYQGSILACIQNAQIIIDRKFELGKQYQSWFIPFYRNYLYYLVKISSNSEIFVRACQQEPEINLNMYLNDFFRIVNQMNTFLSPFNNTLKTVGRYYRQQLKVFEQFYKVLQGQLLKIYRYLRILISGLLRYNEEFSIAEMQAFVISIPEYELMIDQLQQVLLCKYFGGTCSFQQPYLLAQDIAKINYSIHCRKLLGVCK